MVGPTEHAEPLGSIKYLEFLKYLRSVNFS